MARWWIAALAAAMGIVLTGIQTVERLQLLTDPSSSLVCDVNAVLSCTPVLGAWQSSVVFDVPNAFVGGIIFAVLGSTALARLLGSQLNRTTLFTLWALACFFALFATWYMLQTAFVIGALCLWCIGNTTAAGLIAAAMTREVALAGQLGTWAQTASRAGLDVMAWVGWWIALAALVAIGLL